MLLSFFFFPRVLPTPNEKIKLVLRYIKHSLRGRDMDAIKKPTEAIFAVQVMRKKKMKKKWLQNARRVARNE